MITAFVFTVLGLSLMYNAVDCISVAYDDVSKSLEYTAFPESVIPIQAADGSTKYVINYVGDMEGPIVTHVSDFYFDTEESANAYLQTADSMLIVMYHTGEGESYYVNESDFSYSEYRADHKLNAVLSLSVAGVVLLMAATIITVIIKDYKEDDERLQTN